MDAHPLTKYRTDKNLSPDELAKLLGVTRPTVTRWENGTRKPDVAKLADIEAKTGIKPLRLRPELAGLLRK